MAFKNENASAAEKLQINGNDLFAFVKDPVDVANPFGLYMIPCIRKGNDSYRISSNVPIPGNCLVKVNSRHFIQDSVFQGTPSKTHVYRLYIKDPLIIEL